MLKKLKFRFILLAMVSMTLTLLAAFSAVNIALRLQLSNNSDIIIETLYENGGHFLLFKRAESDTDAQPDDDSPRIFGRTGRDEYSQPEGGFMHSETPYETRYYVAYFDEEMTLTKADFGHIALSNIDVISEQIYTIAEGSKTRGYISNYRFGKFVTDDGMMIIGVDCSNDLNTINILTMITLVTIVFCIVIVLMLLLVFSGRVLQPFEENREKQRRFITDAGHELKTPIAIIRSNAEVIEMTDGQSKWLSNIMQQTDRMGKLVRGLIELSKMDEQTLSEKEKQRVEFSEIVENTAESFAVPAQARGVSLETKIEPDVAVTGDLEDIVRMTGILLDNAVKYADEGGRIAVELFAKPKKAVLTVKNTCKGIDGANVSKFFDRFYRGDESRSSETSGYGIGLSMAQMIVQNHKGRISADYEASGDVVFRVELPLER